MKIQYECPTHGIFEMDLVEGSTIPDLVLCLQDCNRDEYCSEAYYVGSPHVSHRIGDESAGSKKHFCSKCGEEVPVMK